MIAHIVRPPQGHGPQVVGARHPMGARVLSAVVLCILIGCSGDDGGPTVTPADTTAPAAVTDLRMSQATTTELVLTWTATGDDGGVGTADRYDLRCASDTLAGWAAMQPVATPSHPRSPGQTESATVSGLAPATAYAVELRVADEVPNWSAASNRLITRTTAPVDTIPPQAPMVTTTYATWESIDLAWTATGDNGMLGGPAATYDLRYADQPNLPWEAQTRCEGEPTPRSPGQGEMFRVSGLLPGRTYHFRLAVQDDAGNWSRLSAAAAGTTTDRPGLVDGHCGLGDHWRAEASPYRPTATTVFTAGTIRIDPGVTVLGTLYVAGAACTLRAEGTAEALVRIERMDFHGASGAALDDTTYGSGSIARHVRFTGRVDCGRGPFFIDCAFVPDDFIGGLELAVTDGPEVRLLRCTFEGIASFAAPLLVRAGRTVILRDCVFRNNNRTDGGLIGGIEIRDGSRCNLLGCTMEDCDPYAVGAYDSHLLVRCSGIHGSFVGIFLDGTSTRDIRLRRSNLDGNNYALDNSSSSDPIATENWWGTVDSTLVWATIRDCRNESDQRGCVEYEPILEAPVAQGDCR